MVAALPATRHARTAVILLALVGSSGAACVRHLPPAPTPPEVAPAVAAGGALGPGQGRLIVDVTDGPSPVARVRMAASPRPGPTRVTFQFQEAPEPLCAVTPCVVDLPVGNLLLGFPVRGKPGEYETELVHVGAETGVYRRALSEYVHRGGAVRTSGIIGASVGGAALVTGITLLPIGLGRDNDGLATAGGLSLGLGAALLTAGILAIRADSPTFRPGSASHFLLATPAGPGAAP